MNENPEEGEEEYGTNHNGFNTANQRIRILFVRFC